MHIKIVTKEEYDKEIEQNKHKQTIKTLTIEHNQALKN